MRLIIKNGKIVTSERIFTSDILCVDGKILEIGESIEIAKTDKIMDAAGHYVFPGGIDPHVHMHLSTPMGYSSDDFYSGSKAALFGGTTTLIDFVTPRKGQSLIDALEERKAEAAKSIVDFSFHVSSIEWKPSTGNEISSIISDEGITSFKMYMAYKNSIGLEDNDIYKVMKVVGGNGGIVTMHCELGDDIEELRNSLASENKLSPEYHPISRPAKMEAEAVRIAIELANRAECPLYIVHVSSKESLKYIKKAQENGQKVYAESCPQYLMLDDSNYQGGFDKSAPYVLSPPLRKKEDNNAIWKAIGEGSIETIGTDHCPFLMEQKKMGIEDFRKIPNGAGGVEYRLSLLFTYGVLEDRISLNQFVRITSTNAAKIFGLYPQKGEIAIGSDADLIVWNPNKENTITVKSHHQNCDSNIYEGISTKGEAEYVVRKGEIVIEKGKLKAENKGVFLKRSV